MKDFVNCVSSFLFFEAHTSKKLPLNHVQLFKFP
jgi:hypothetical protein